MGKQETPTSNKAQGQECAHIHIIHTTHYTHTYLKTKQTIFKNQTKLRECLSGRHVPSAHEALGLISSTGVGKEGKDEETWQDAIQLWFLVASSQKCKCMDELQLDGSFIFTWRPQQSVPQMRTACVSWKQAIRLPPQTELTS